MIDGSRNGTFAAVSASGAIGYSAGTGGTVTQATSKSTAVTLNKLSGDITTPTASLGNAATVSFAVNNAQVQAGDVVIANVVSGNANPGAYQVWVEAIANGGFRVVLRNITGTALSEALVVRFMVLRAANA